MVITQKDIEDSIAKALESQTLTLKDHISESISVIRNEIITKLTDENLKLKERINILEIRNNELEIKLDTLEIKLESNLQYQRNASVIICGIPREVEHGKLEGTVLNIFNKVCLHHINNRDIVACHRLSATSDSIIVKFVNKKDAVALLGRKIAIKELDTSLIAPNCNNLYVNEQLTPYMGQLAYKCRCLKRANKIYQTKVENGIEKVLTNKNGSFRWYNVTSEVDINQFDEVIVPSAEGD